jgi:sarcosine oxidase
VTALEPAGDVVRVHTGAGSFDSGAVVVTAGAWAQRVLATAGIELEALVTRETVAYLRLNRSEPPPSLIHEVRPGRIPYALAAPGIGLKVCVHQTGETVKPDSDDGPNASLAAEAAAWAAERFPDVNPEPIALETCLYTNLPGDRFLLERHGRIVVGSVCSGHGFKFAPTTGRRLAALAAEACG